MIALLIFLLRLLVLPSKPKRRLEAENAALRQQLTILQRKQRGRAQFTKSDRLFFVQLYRWFPSILKTIRSSSRRRCCAGIARASVATGVGSPGIAEEGHPSQQNCGR